MKLQQQSELKIFFPKRVPLRSLSSSFIDSFNFAMKRCNTSQGFDASSFSHVIDSSSLFISFISFLFFPLSFLIFFKIVVTFLIKQLFYSGLLDIK